jgi:hypothetical protein
MTSSADSGARHGSMGMELQRQPIVVARAMKGRQFCGEHHLSGLCVRKMTPLHHDGGRTPLSEKQTPFTVSRVRVCRSGLPRVWSLVLCTRHTASGLLPLIDGRVAPDILPQTVSPCPEQARQRLSKQVRIPSFYLR